jgi:hypothetical protein
VVPFAPVVPFDTGSSFAATPTLAESDGPSRATPRGDGVPIERRDEDGRLPSPDAYQGGQRPDQEHGEASSKYGETLSSSHDRLHLRTRRPLYPKGRRMSGVAKDESSRRETPCARATRIVDREANMCRQIVV